MPRGTNDVSICGGVKKEISKKMDLNGNLKNYEFSFRIFEAKYGEKFGGGRLILGEMHFFWAEPEGAEFLDDAILLGHEQDRCGDVGCHL